MTSAQRLDRSLRSYLSQHGWLEQHPGPSGSLWQLVGAGSEPVIAVPAGELSPGQAEWRSVIERLALFESRTAEEVTSSVVNQFTDITYLRAANDFRIAGSIPLTAGASLMSSARDMLRCSATTAQRARSQIGGNFSRIGDAILASARVGHTIEGSYIIPLLVPLTDAEDDDPSTPPITGLEQERADLEPSERRVTRTFAEALTAVKKIVVEPAREPSSRITPDLVVAGVSREFVVALKKIVMEPAVANFEATFSWAAGARSPSGIPESVDIPHASGELLAMTARLLKQNRREATQTITGPIVEVRHVPKDPFGEVAIQTIRGGRPTEVRVRLAMADINQCLEWMRSAKTVIVEGDILRTPGRPLRIERPSRFNSLESTFLGGSD